MTNNKFFFSEDGCNVIRLADIFAITKTKSNGTDNYTVYLMQRSVYGHPTTIIVNSDTAAELFEAISTADTEISS